MAEIQGPGDNPWDVDFNDLYDLEEIGGGNFGKVYKAKLNHLDVAIKQLYDIDDEFMFKYIEREMALLKEMRHPNIVKFLGLCKSDEGDIFIVTEFVPGGDLRHILKDKNFPLPWKLRISIAMDLAKALQYLHSQGIIHRDVKSNNLLVEEDWTIKVCDFGFARDIDKSTESMTLCGTDEWMAPEVALGEKYDAKADVFSFGMVIVELITRKKPPLRQPGRAFALIQRSSELPFLRTAHKILLKQHCCAVHGIPKIAQIGKIFWQFSIICFNHFPKKNILQSLVNHNLYHQT